MTSTMQYYCMSVYIISPCVYSGGVSEHETLGNVECYNPNTNHWVVDVIPQMKYRRSGVGRLIPSSYSLLPLFRVGVAVLQGLLFAIGGYLEGKTFRILFRNI